MFNCSQVVQREARIRAFIVGEASVAASEAECMDESMKIEHEETEDLTSDAGESGKSSTAELSGTVIQAQASQSPGFNAQGMLEKSAEVFASALRDMDGVESVCSQVLISCDSLMNDLES